MKWIVLLSVLFFSVSCSDNTEKVNVKTASVNAEFTQGTIEETSTKATGFKRGEAPVYIAGVKLIATNVDYSGNDTSEEFYFKNNTPNDGKDIILADVKVGRNDFSAEGICNATAENRHFTNIQTVTGADMDAKASKYSIVLEGKKSIYAKYVQKDVVRKTIEYNKTNNIALEMITRTHRVGIVMDNPTTSVYYLKWKVLDGDDVLFASSNNGYVAPNKREAFIINSADAQNSNTYTVELTYYYKEGTTYNQVLEDDGDPIVLKKYIVAKANDDITKYYKFKDREIVTGTANPTITWTPMNKKTDGEEF